MSNIGELSVGVKVDEWSLTNATKKVQTEFKKTWDGIEQNFTNKSKQGISSIGSSLSGLSWLLAWAFSIAGIVSFTKNLFQLWSDMTEIGSKFDVVFKWSEAVKQQFQDMADATNRSNLDLITFGSSIGNVLAPMGLAQSEVDWLSVWLTKLAIDVASFNNVSDEQAVNAFTTALTGERESLKSLWIVISQTDVQNKAYKLWLAKTGEELTKQQTALATYQLLLDNTKNAQWDAIRTWDSFANQLKWLRGAIKDVFANAGKDVAGQTAWLLKNITVFVSSYGGAIISTIVEAWKMIGWVIGDLMKTFGQLFSFISWWTDQEKDDLASTAFVFMKVVQGFGVGVKLIATIIKTLVDLTAIQIAVWVEIFMFAFNSIGDGWNIVKTMFIWTLKTIVDANVLTWTIIAQVFVGVAEALVGVFKWIADNVGVAVKKAWNLAIKWLNWFIDLANKIPWVDIGKLTGLGDDSWKWFDLKIWKNIGALWGQLDAFGKKVGSNYAGIGASFGNISNNFKSWVANVVAVSDGALWEIWNTWTQLWTDIQASNDAITKSLEDGANKQKDNAKKYDEGYFNILDILDKYKGWVEKWDKANKKANETASKAIDAIKKQYTEWEKKVDDLNKASKKLAEDTTKYNTDIADSIRTLWNELDSVTKKYQDAVAQIKTDTAKDIATRWVEVTKDLASVEKQIADLKADSSKDAVEKQKELTDLETQKTALLKEQSFIIANTTEAQRAEASRRAWLSDAERIKEDAQVSIDAKTKEFEAEKQKNESLQRINTYFAGLKSLTQQQLDKVTADQRFLAMSQEEQELILKLGREKIQLTNQKNEIIQMQQDIATATQTLSNETTAIQMTNIASLKSEYATLIAQIQTAISKQRELNAVKQGGWFADGWFTWSGWKFDVKWVVHAWEWVAPQWMVNSMKPLFDSLESARGKGFAEWWYTNTVNKTQNNTITVNGGADLKGFIDYAKWKL